jgi:hypothetical protein
MAENFNVSIPYQQVYLLSFPFVTTPELFYKPFGIIMRSIPQLKSCRKRESKFGPAMVLETNSKAGG